MLRIFNLLTSFEFQLNLISFFGVKRNRSYYSAVQKTKKLIEAFMLVNHHIPGLSLTIYQDGKLLYNQGIGYEDLKSKVKVSPSQTMFRIGSISKTVTATLMGKLIEEGKLDIEKSIYHYLPSFPKKKFDFKVRHLACHQSGIRHYYTKSEIKKGKKEHDQDVHYENVQDSLIVFNEDPLLFKPGTKYGYTTYGYVLLSAILQKAGRSSFQSLLKKRIFGPLGLKNMRCDDIT